MYCSSCGSSLRPGEQICPGCGAHTPDSYAGSGTSSSDPTVISSPDATERSSLPSNDATVPSQPANIKNGNPPTAYAAYPYGAQLTLSGQQQPYTPLPNTVYSPVPPPPPSNAYGARPPGAQVPSTPIPTAPVSTYQQQKPPRRRGALIAILAVIILLLIGGSLLTYASNVQHQNQLHVQATATAQVQAQQYATSTAIAQVTATANVQVTAAAANPYSPGAKLLFTDPLSDNSQGHKWDTNNNCTFKDGTYHAIAPDANFADYCIAQATDYKDFVYEVEMKLVRGDGGGIDFRASNTDTENRYYDFYIFQNGNYSLDVSGGGKDKTLTSGTSVAIKTGVNQTNVLAVKVQGPIITVYVNQLHVSTVSDTTYTHGQIGVEADPLANTGQPTEVIYSNARVWTL